MIAALDSFRDFSFFSVLIRLLLAMAFGGLIGFERGKHHKGAGLRTYILVCLGATLGVLLSQYYSHMVYDVWAPAVTGNVDVSRIAMQTITGVGFLAAGTILMTQQSKVKGLTTAAGLWASACAGLAIGAGFFEGVLMMFVFMLICLVWLPRLEKRRAEETEQISREEEHHA